MRCCSTREKGLTLILGALTGLMCRAEFRAIIPASWLEEKKALSRSSFLFWVAADSCQLSLKERSCSKVRSWRYRSLPPQKHSSWENSRLYRSEERCVGQQG